MHGIRYHPSSLPWVCPTLDPSTAFTNSGFAPGLLHSPMRTLSVDLPFLLRLSFLAPVLPLSPPKPKQSFLRLPPRLQPLISRSRSPPFPPYAADIQSFPASAFHLSSLPFLNTRSRPAFSPPNTSQRFASPHLPAPRFALPRNEHHRSPRHDQKPHTSLSRRSSSSSLSLSPPLSSLPSSLSLDRPTYRPIDRSSGATTSSTTPGQQQGAKQPQATQSDPKRPKTTLAKILP